MKLRKTKNKGQVREFTKAHAERILKMPNSGWEKAEKNDTGKNKEQPKQEPDSTGSVTPK